MSDFGSTTHFAGRDADKAFDTSKSKIGSVVGTTYTPLLTNITSQRLYVTFTNQNTFDSIIVNNYHHNGTQTDRGTKNVKIYTTENAGAINTVFESAITGGVLVYDGVFAEHVAANQEDPETLVLIG